MINDIKEAKGRSIVLGHLINVEAHPKGWVCELESNDGDKIEVTVSPKLAKDLTMEPLMIAYGVVHKNQSGRRWMIAEKVQTGKDLGEEDIAKWQDLDKRAEERELQKKGIQLTPKHLRQDKREVVNQMDAAFQQLREKYRRGE